MVISLIMAYFSDGSISSIGDTTTPFFDVKGSIDPSKLNSPDAAIPGETILGYWVSDDNWQVAFCRKYEENPNEWIVGEEDSDAFNPPVGWLPIPTTRLFDFSKHRIQIIYDALTEYIEVEEDYDLANEANEIQELFKQLITICE